MSGGNKFRRRREYTKGSVRVDVGFRSRELAFRIQHHLGIEPISLSFDAAYDLADALDAALADQEEDPLL